MKDDEIRVAVDLKIDIANKLKWIAISNRSNLKKLIEKITTEYVKLHYKRD